MVTLPFVIDNLPATPQPSAAVLDANFNALAEAINSETSGTTVALASFGAITDGTHDCTAALLAAVATGFSVDCGEGEIPVTQTIKLSAAGQRLIGVAGDKTRIVKWANVVLVDLEGDSCGMQGVTLVGQFQRNTAIAEGLLNPASPVVTDTTTLCTQGATSVGVIDSPTNATLIDVRLRFGGLDGMDFMEGESPYWRNVIVESCARWGFNGSGVALGRAGLVAVGCTADFCGFGTQAGGGGWNITWQNSTENLMQAHSNYGPGFITATTGKNNAGVIFDEKNGTSNSLISAWVTATVYGANNVVSNTWSISTTTNGVIAATTRAVPVVSGLNIPNGTAITIAGAGPGGANFKVLVVSGGGTNTLTLEYPTSTAVTNAAVTGSALGLFIATNAATSGATPPTVATGTFFDGGVTWQSRDGNAVNLLAGGQSEFYAVVQNGPSVVSNSYAAGIFNNLEGAPESNAWALAGVARSAQRFRITQAQRFLDPLWATAANTLQGLDLEAPIPGSPSIFRFWAPGVDSQTLATIVFGDTTGQPEAPVNIPIRISGPTLALSRAGGNLTNIAIGGRVFATTVTAAFDFATSGLGGIAVDASDANTYLCDATAGAFNFNIEGGGTGAAPGDWKRIVKIDTGGNAVTVKGLGFYIVAGGSNTQVAMSGGVAVSAAACDIVFELLSLTAGTGSTPLWLKRV